MLFEAIDPGSGINISPHDVLPFLLLLLRFVLFTIQIITSLSGDLGAPPSVTAVRHVCRVRPDLALRRQRAWKDAKLAC